MKKSFRSRRFITRLLVGLVLGLFLGLNDGVVAQRQRSTKKKKASQAFQGICGTVVVKRGNQMPAVNRPRSNGKPVQREVLIYELTNQSQVQATAEGFYQTVATRLVKTAKSDADGKFCVSLPPGQYSVFVREEKGLYANLFDGHNNIFPVTVQADQSSTIKFEITHGAVF